MKVFSTGLTGERFSPSIYNLNRNIPSGQSARWKKNALSAGLAASLIDDGDIVFINSGTTTTHLIRQIRTNSNITVVTNNLTAALEIGESDLELIMIGGVFQPKSNSVAGRFAIDNLKQIYADKAFIGVDGITIRHGYTVPSNNEAEVIRLMAERTKGPINVLADHTKWGTVSNFEIAQINEIPLLITDEQLGQIATEALSKWNIQVLVPNGITVSK